MINMCIKYAYIHIYIYIYILTIYRVLLLSTHLSASLLPAAIAIGVNSTLPHTSPRAYTPLVVVF